jgi:U3 small nucleolar RNA-associated protein 25
MDPEDANTPTTRLLTLLNVSALKSRKRTRDTEESESGPHEKLNKRKSNKFTGAEPEREAGPSVFHGKTNAHPDGHVGVDDEEIEETEGDGNDPAGKAVSECTGLPGVSAHAAFRFARPIRAALWIQTPYFDG